MVDWKKVRGGAGGLTEDEKEELINRLNKYVEQYRTMESIYVQDEDEGWGYWPEGEHE